MPAKPSTRIKEIERQLGALPHLPNGKLKIILDRATQSLSIDSAESTLLLVVASDVELSWDEPSGALTVGWGNATMIFRVQHGISVVIQDEEMSSVKRSAALGVRGRRNGAAIVARTAYSTLIHRHLGLTGRPT